MATSLNIVVVEDHDALREVTVEFLRQHGHHVTGFSCAEEFDDEAAATYVDLFVLDLNLPGEDGISLSQRLRKAHPNIGIIMVTARSQPHDKITGFDSGADIYLPKPVVPLELLSAINALVRRLKPQSDSSSHSLSLNQRALLLTGSAGKTAVSHSESILLIQLARAPNHCLEYWQLLELLGQPTNKTTQSNLEVRIARLRKRITQIGGGENGIKSIRLQGYQLCVPLHVE